jgi:hypothetical protein
MVQSLPVMFVSHYLQGSTGTIVLENPDGRTWRVEWSAWEQSGRRLALTAGWPEFARFHGAKIGDVILFEILDNSRFKFLFISPANTNGGSSSEVKFLHTHDQNLGLLFEFQVSEIEFPSV